MPKRLSLPILSFTAYALLAGGAMAQSLNAPSAGQPVGGPNTEPFISPGADIRPYTPPPFSHGSGYDQRDLSSKGSFDFDSLLTPGTRGSKRSLSRRSRADFRFDESR